MEIRARIKASETEQLQVLKEFKKEYFEMCAKLCGRAKELALNFPPWDFYEDAAGNNVFRVIGVDESVDEEETKRDPANNAEEGVAQLRNQSRVTLTCAKLEKDCITEIMGVEPEMIRKTNGWKGRQLELINSSPFPDGFLRPMGFLGIKAILHKQAAEVRAKKMCL